MEKMPKKKMVFGSIAISLIIVVITTAILPYSSVLSILGPRGTLAGWVVLVLLGIELARQELAQKYNLSFGKFLLLTFLPAVLVYGVYVCFYVYMENNYWAELEGMLGQIILFLWGGCIGVSAGGTLLIAFVRWLGTRCKKEKEEKVE